MKNFDLHPPLDLIEVRRRLTQLRSLHSNDRRITRAINNLIRKLAHLREPESRRHEERLLKAIAKTIQRIDEILCDQSVAPEKVD
jgi:type VI protein secretion system component VasF